MTYKDVSPLTKEERTAVLAKLDKLGVGASSTTDRLTIWGADDVRKLLAALRAAFPELAPAEEDR